MNRFGRHVNDRNTPPILLHSLLRQVLKRHGLFTLALLYLAVSTIHAANVAEPYEVATWQGFRSAAISYTFDDGTDNQFAVAIPMFNEAGLKLTLFTVTESTWAFPGWDKLQAAADDGHEIASHTATHRNFADLSNEEQLLELEVSKESIDDNIGGQTCVTMAYPFCVAGNDSYVAANYIGARTCSGQVVPATPANFMRISSVVCGDQGSVNSLATFQSTAGSALAQGGWMVYLLHGVDNDGGYSPVTNTTLQASVDFFVENENLYWVDTFGNIVRYIKERNAVSVSETSISNSRFTLSVTDTLDDAVYNYPITLSRQLPEEWKAVQVKQNGESVSSKIVHRDANRFVEFDAVPDKGEVTIERVFPMPKLIISNSTGNNTVTLRLEGMDGETYTLLDSSDLENWSPYQENITDIPADIIIETSEISRFYKASASVPSGTSDPVIITPESSLIQYSGRSEITNDGGIVFGYSGARSRMRFEGTSVGMWMDDELDQNYVSVYIDGIAVNKFLLDANEGYYTLAGNLEAGIHTVEVVRVTECFLGLNYFKGFEVGGDNAKALEWQSNYDRKIEFIGDSITCGYGVEVDDRDLHFEAATENFSLSYSGLAARTLDADYVVVSRSGIGMFRNYDGPYEGSTNTMPDVYSDLFYQKPEYGTWTYNQFIPDVICINLGTNDFSTTGVNVSKFIDAYVDFGTMLVNRYPNAELVLIQGPMNNGSELRNALTQIASELSVVAPNRINSLELSTQGSVGFGADWHPNQQQSIINAAELVDYLSDLMSWD